MKGGTESLYVCLHVCMCVHTHRHFPWMLHRWRTGDNPQELPPSIQHVYLGIKLSSSGLAASIFTTEPSGNYIIHALINHLIQGLSKIQLVIIFKRIGDKFRICEFVSEFQEFSQILVSVYYRVYKGIQIKRSQISFYIFYNENLNYQFF